MPGALVVTFVRSPLAFATIDSIDVVAARSAPGVVAVYTGEDVAGLGCLPVNPVLEAIELPPYRALALGSVCAVGQPVVAIVAESESAGLVAADLVELELDESRPTLFGVIGSEADRPVFSRRWTAGDCEQAFDKAAHVVCARVVHPRLAAVSMEPRAIAVGVDAASDSLTIWLSSQTPHRAREHLAAMLGVDSARLRVIAPDVGGAFGLKASIYPEELFTVWAAMTLGCPVRWSASRSEDFLSATHGRGGISNGQLALSEHGRFLGLRAEIQMPLGHWLPNSGAIPAWNAARILPGPYQVPTVDIRTRGILTHTAAVGIYRGAGRPEAAALMERLVEQAAAATGQDSLAIRERNLVEPDRMPYAGPTGIRIDSGQYRQAIDALKALVSYGQMRATVQRRRQAGELIGIGLAMFIEPCGTGWESARVETDPSGAVTAYTGSSSQGQGRETAYAAIVARALGVSVDAVTVVHGDTARCPPGIGALASRSTAIGGSAMLEAARKVRRQQLASGHRDAFSAEVVYEPVGEAWGYGIYLVLASIDRETGVVRLEQIAVVDDIGTVIDAELARGQILGGIAQGIGEALLERIVYDEAGQLLTGSLMDYAVPRASDMPPVTIRSLRTASPFNALGAKGVGEAGAIGTPAAITNAVYDALAHDGLDPASLHMPFTSGKIWQFLQSGPKQGILE